jgi:hypothetical protein
MLVTILLTTGLSLVTPLIFRQLIDRHGHPSKDLNQLMLFSLALAAGSIAQRRGSTSSSGV